MRLFGDDADEGIQEEVIPIQTQLTHKHTQQLRNNQNKHETHPITYRISKIRS